MGGVLWLGVSAVTAAAQQPSAVGDMLRNAQRALDDTHYGRADSLARSLLRSGAVLSREERITALMIVAAALYPEAAAQQRDSALVFLRQLIRLWPDAVMARDLTWQGLNDLLEETRATTFAVRARPRPDNAVVGSTAAIEIPVEASRRAVVRLVVTARGDPRPLVIDSAGPARDVLLRMRLFDADRQLVPAGSVIITIIAVDSTNDTIVQRFPGTVAAPVLELVSIPASVDSTELLPEWLPPKRALNIAIGAGLGGLTVLLGSALRAAEPVASSVSGDSRRILIGASFAVGGLLGAVLDRGKPLVANAAHNRQILAVFDERVRVAREDNEARRTTYRARVTVGDALQ